MSHPPAALLTHKKDRGFASGRTVRCDVCRVKRVRGLEFELRLVPDDGFIAGVRLHFDDTMPGFEAR
jgi:hypothetical protein